MIVPGEGFCSLQVVSRGGMVMDEIDTCISVKPSTISDKNFEFGAHETFKPGG